MRVSVAVVVARAAEMEKVRRERIKHREEVLVAHLADLKCDVSDKDVQAAVKLGRWEPMYHSSLEAFAWSRIGFQKED